MLIGLKREPLVAYGGFYTREEAEDFTRRKGGQLVELDWAHGRVPDEGSDHLGAV
jgi:hypothetical protein